MTRTRRAAFVGGALGLLALGLLLARPSTGASGTDHVVSFLRLSGTGPRPSDSRRAVGASLRGEPLPPGICLVQLQPGHGLDWRGRRSREIEVRSALGALLEVRLESEGRLLARVEPGAETWRVPLRLEAASSALVPSASRCARPTASSSPSRRRSRVSSRRPRSGSRA